MPATDKLTILFLAANPGDTTPLLLDEEVRAIDQALREAEYRDRFDLRQHWALRYNDLTALLLRYNPHIVHFSGHGSASGELAFTDETGKSHLVAPDALADLFSILRDNIRCVVLNACYSETQAAGIAQSIDCVVGMTRAVADDAAVKFAGGFYLGLGYGRSVATAFGLGRNSMGAYVAGEETAPKLLSPRVDPGTITLVGASAPAPSTPAGSAPAESAPAESAPAAPAPDGALVVPPLQGLKGKQLRAAMDALLSAFDRQSLKRMVLFYLDVNLDAIVGGGSLSETVFELLQWAERSGRLRDLLQGAIDDNPGNRELRAFILSLQ